MIPDECLMPDLSDLKKLQGALLLRVVFAQADSGISEKAAPFRRLFIRLIDKAIYEYSQAREYLIAQVEERKRPVEEMKEGRPIYMFSFSDHMENCINAVRRLLRLVDRLKRDRYAPTIPKQDKRWFEANTDTFKDSRDAVEHMDERINDSIDDNSPVESIFFRIVEDGESVEIANNRLKFVELASMLRKLHELATYLVEHTDKPKKELG